MIDKSAGMQETHRCSFAKSDVATLYSGQRMQTLTISSWVTWSLTKLLSANTYIVDRHIRNCCRYMSFILNLTSRRWSGDNDHANGHMASRVKRSTQLSFFQSSTWFLLLRPDMFRNATVRWRALPPGLESYLAILPCASHILSSNAIIGVQSCLKNLKYRSATCTSISLAQRGEDLAKKVDVS